MISISAFTRSDGSTESVGHEITKYSPLYGLICTGKPRFRLGGKRILPQWNFYLSLKETSARRIIDPAVSDGSEWVSEHGIAEDPIIHCTFNSFIVFRLLPNQRGPHSQIKILRWFHHRTSKRGTWQVSSSFFTRSSARERKKLASGWVILLLRRMNSCADVIWNFYIVGQINHTVSLSVRHARCPFQTTFTPSRWKIIINSLQFQSYLISTPCNNFALTLLTQI